MQSQLIGSVKSVDNQWTVSTGVQCTGSAHSTIKCTISARTWMASVRLCILLKTDRDLWAYHPSLKNESGLLWQVYKDRSGHSIGLRIDACWSCRVHAVGHPAGVLCWDNGCVDTASNMQINVPRTVHQLPPDCALIAN